MKKTEIHIFIILALVFFGCKDAEIQPKDYSIVITNEATDIDVNGVTLRATVKSFGKQPVNEYGFLLSRDGVERKISVIKNLSSSYFDVRVSSSLDSGIVYKYEAYLRTEQYLILGDEVEFISKGSGSVTINSISPVSGFENTKVRIVGENFTLNKNDIKVYINNQPAEIIYSDVNYIDIIVPKIMKSGDFEVKVLSGKHTLIAPQKFKILETTIQSVSPLSGTPGTEITITGQNLMRCEATSVLLGGSVLSILDIISISNDVIKIKVPLNTNYLLFDASLDLTILNDELKTTYNKQFIIKKTWQEKSVPTSSAPLEFINGFTYKNKVYVFDRNNGNMWYYEPDTDKWGMIENSRLNMDNYAGTLYIPYENKFYRVGGYTYTGVRQQAYWIYNIDNNVWSVRYNLPFSFVNATSFVSGSTIYVLTSEKQLWKCNFDNNTFQRLNDFPDQPTNDFIGSFTANGNIYAFQYGKTWQYDQINDTWTYKSFNHFTYDHYGKGPIFTNVDNTGFIFEQTIFLYKYDFLKNRLSMVSLYPGVNTESKKALLVYNNSLYILGYDSFGRYNPKDYLFLFLSE